VRAKNFDIIRVLFTPYRSAVIECIYKEPPRTISVEAYRNYWYNLYDYSLPVNIESFVDIVFPETAKFSSSSFQTAVTSVLFDSFGSYSLAHVNISHSYPSCCLWSPSGLQPLPRGYTREFQESSVQLFLDELKHISSPFAPLCSKSNISTTVTSNSSESMALFGFKENKKKIMAIHLSEKLSNNLLPSFRKCSDLIKRETSCRDNHLDNLEDNLDKAQQTILSSENELSAGETICYRELSRDKNVINKIGMESIESVLSISKENTTKQSEFWLETAIRSNNDHLANVKDLQLQTDTIHFPLENPIGTIANSSKDASSQIIETKKKTLGTKRSYKLNSNSKTISKKKKESLQLKPKKMP